MHAVVRQVVGQINKIAHSTPLPEELKFEMANGTVQYLKRDGAETLEAFFKNNRELFSPFHCKEYALYFLQHNPSQKIRVKYDMDLMQGNYASFPWLPGDTLLGLSDSLYDFKLEGGCFVFEKHEHVKAKDNLQYLTGSNGA